MAYKLEVYEYGAYVIDDLGTVVQYVDLFNLLYDKSGTYYYEYELAEESSSTIFLLSAKKSSKINPRDIHYELVGDQYTQFFFNFDGVYSVPISKSGDDLALTRVPQAAIGGGSDPDHYVVAKVNNIHVTEDPVMANIDIYLYILDQDSTGYLFYRVVNIGNYDLPWVEGE